MSPFTRIAAICTLVIFFTLSIVVTILGTQSIGTQITHGSIVGHEHGIILSKSDSDNSLVFKTDSNQVMEFACNQRCLIQLEHIQRHIYERAPTDIYYQPENNVLVAVDVD